MSIEYANANATVSINGTNISNLLQGDYLVLEYTNPLTDRVNSSDGGVGILPRFDAGVGTLKLTVQRLSSSDTFLNGLSGNFDGSIITRFTNNSVEFTENWSLFNMSKTDQPTHTRNNQEDDQSVEYTFEFRNATRIV